MKSVSVYEDCIAASITLHMTTSCVKLIKFIHLQLQFLSLRFGTAGSVAFRVLIPCILVGGYRIWREILPPSSGLK